jgi:hypothetical protein
VLRYVKQYADALLTKIGGGLTRRKARWRTCWTIRPNQTGVCMRSITLTVLRKARAIGWIGALLLLLPWPSQSIEQGADLASAFMQVVDKRLDVPPDEVRRYADLMSSQFLQAGLTALLPQYVVVVDRNPNVQALLIFWKDADGAARLIGAAPVSTGRIGEFDHFETPTGVFDHSIDNLDFRAEGTKNELGICGYGAKGMRVYDFGWQQAYKGWGDRGLGMMRLQMHATDPDILEARLGSVQSKGCIRIPATVNHFIDHYGLLDAGYEEAMLSGTTFWMLAADRTPTPWSGRYLIVVDTHRDERPFWSPAPVLPRVKPAVRK